MRVLAAALALCVAVSAVGADSQPPPPSSGEHPSANQKQTADESAKSKGNSATPQKPPPSLNLNCPPTASGEPNKSEEKPDQTAPKQWWKDPNWVIAALTFVLAVAALAQFSAAFLQWCSMRGQIKFAREEFVAVHRPKVLVRDAFPLELERDKPIIVMYSVTNTGGTKATIVRSALNVRYVNTSGLRLDDVTTERNDLNFSELVPGELKNCEFISDLPFRLNFVDQSETMRFEFGLFFSGHIIYQDEIGNFRHTVFRRRYSYMHGRFMRQLEGEDQQEYAD